MEKAGGEKGDAGRGVWRRLLALVSVAAVVLATGEVLAAVAAPSSSDLTATGRVLVLLWLAGILPALVGKRAPTMLDRLIAAAWAGLAAFLALAAFLGSAFGPAAGRLVIFAGVSAWWWATRPRRGDPVVLPGELWRRLVVVTVSSGALGGGWIGSGGLTLDQVWPAAFVAFGTTRIMSPPSLCRSWWTFAALTSVPLALVTHRPDGFGLSMILLVILVYHNMRFDRKGWRNLVGALGLAIVAALYGPVGSGPLLGATLVLVYREAALWSWSLVLGLALLGGVLAAGVHPAWGTFLGVGDTLLRLGETVAMDGSVGLLGPGIVALIGLAALIDGTVHRGVAPSQRAEPLHLSGWTALFSAWYGHGDWPYTAIAVAAMLFAWPVREDAVDRRGSHVLGRLLLPWWCAGVLAYLGGGDRALLSVALVGTILATPAWLDASREGRRRGPVEALLQSSVFSWHLAVTATWWMWGRPVGGVDLAWIDGSRLLGAGLPTTVAVTSLALALGAALILPFLGAALRRRRQARRAVPTGLPLGVLALLCVALLAWPRGTPFVEGWVVVDGARRFVFPKGEPTRAEAVEIASYEANAPHLATGEVIAAWAVARPDDSLVAGRWVRMGLDTAEWAVDMPDFPYRIGHAEPPRSAPWWTRSPDGRSFLGQAYRSCWALPRAETLGGLTVRMEPFPRVQLGLRQAWWHGGLPRRCWHEVDQIEAPLGLVPRQRAVLTADDPRPAWGARVVVGRESIPCRGWDRPLLGLVVEGASTSPRRRLVQRGELVSDPGSDEAQVIWEWHQPIVAPTLRLERLHERACFSAEPLEVRALNLIYRQLPLDPLAELERGRPR